MGVRDGGIHPPRCDQHDRDCDCKRREPTPVEDSDPDSRSDRREKHSPTATGRIGVALDIARTNAAVNIKPRPKPASACATAIQAMPPCSFRETATTAAASARAEGRKTAAPGCRESHAAASAAPTSRDAVCIPCPSTRAAPGPEPPSCCAITAGMASITVSATKLRTAAPATTQKPSAGAKVLIRLPWGASARASTGAAPGAWPRSSTARTAISTSSNAVASRPLRVTRSSSPASGPTSGMPIVRVTA